MALIVIYTDGSWFITCTLAIAASILQLSIQLCRAAKAVEESITSQKNAQLPENTFYSQTPTEVSTSPAQTTQGPAPSKDFAEDALEPLRKPSFSTTVHGVKRRLSLPRSKSLSFFRRPQSKPFLEHAPTPPPPLLLPVDSLSLGVPALAEPFNVDNKGDSKRAEPPISTLDSSATIGTQQSASKDNCMVLAKDKTEPLNTQMAPAQAMLTAPAASLAMSTTTSSSSSSSPKPRPRTTPAPKGPRPRPASMSALGADGRRRYARPACPENSLPGEIFETRFENPFKPRSRSLTVKGEKASDTSDSTPTAKRHSIFSVFSNLRKSLVKHKRGSDTEASSERLSGSESSSPSGSSPSSRRTSLSSATGTTLSVGSRSGSTKSKWSSLSTCCVRNGVPRTDPYGPPYSAQTPVPSSNSEGRRARRRSPRA